MGKPGPRSSHIEIIDRHDLKSPLRRAVEGVVTVALWAAWAYWILPVLLTVVLWVFGIRMIYLSLFDPEHLRELQEILFNGGISILVIFLFNIAWIAYNYHFIYRKFRKRRRQGCVSAEVRIAGHFKVPIGQIMEARKNNRFEISLSNGKAVVTSATTVPSSR